MQTDNLTQLRNLWHDLDSVKGEAAEVIFSGLVSLVGGSAQTVVGSINSALKNANESVLSDISTIQLPWQIATVLYGFVGSDVSWQVRTEVLCAVDPLIRDRLNNVEDAVLGRLSDHARGLLKD
jgi:hypothetical protein